MKRTTLTCLTFSLAVVTIVYACKKSPEQSPNPAQNVTQSTNPSILQRTNGVEVYSNTPTYLSADYEVSNNRLFTFIAEVIDDVTTSTLTIMNSGTIISISFSEDRGVAGYKLGSHLQVIDQAEDFKDSFTSSQCENALSNFEKFC